MQVSPGLDAFTATYHAGKAQVAWTTLVADLETPVSAMLKLADRRANSFLLDHRPEARSGLALHRR